MNEGLLEAESAVFFHWILQACCQEKDEKIHFSPEMCEKKKQRAQLFYKITATEAQTHGKLLH